MVTGGNAKAGRHRRSIAEELSLATQHYERRSPNWRRWPKADTGALDPAWPDAQQNIRRSIGDCREPGALTQDPGSEPARESLFEALRQKVVVLQATLKLMNEMRKGNQAGAAEAAAAFSKKS